jgi:hypothetical protein
MTITSAWNAINWALTGKYADSVYGWVQDILGEEVITGYEANVAQQIENQINPPAVTPLPRSA